MRCQHVLVDAAIRVAQERHLRIGREEALQTGIGRGQVELGGRGLRDALAHQHLERSALHLGGIEKLDIDIGHLRPDAFDLLALGVVPFGLSDLLAGHLGDARARVDEGVIAAVDAGEHKGRHDQHQQQELENARVLAKEIKHRKPQAKA